MGWDVGLVLSVWGDDEDWEGLEKEEKENGRGWERLGERYYRIHVPKSPASKNPSNFITTPMAGHFFGVQKTLESIALRGEHY